MSFHAPNQPLMDNLSSDDERPVKARRIVRACLQVSLKLLVHIIDE
jgi:hypothetical protein